MVRLTADLIWKSPHFFNAIKERELDLRGIPISLKSFLLTISLFESNFLIFFTRNKIAVIENLGASEVCIYSSFSPCIAEVFFI